MASNVLSIGITSNTRGLQKGLAGAKGQLTGFSGQVAKVRLNLGTMVKGFAAFTAITKGGAFLKGSITEASNLNETINKSNAIFPKSGKSVLAWSKNSATAFGLSRSAALEMNAGFGDMFQQLGMNESAAKKMSAATVKMAADQGSFNNLPTAEVGAMISSAYRGEYDSLQRIIPNINAARVEKEAMIMTGKKSAKQLTAEDKAMAVNAIVTKDGARANGDFKKTSNELANSQKILAAKTKDLQAKIGQLLLPAMKFATNAAIKLVSAVSKSGPTFKKLGSAISSVAGFLNKHKTAIAVTAGIIGTLFLPLMIQMGVAFVVNAARTLTMNAAWLVYGITIKATSIATKAYAAAQWLLNAAMTANPIGLVVVAIVGLVAGLIFAYKHSETFRNIVNGAFKAVMKVVGVVCNFIKNNWKKIGLVLLALSGPLGLMVLLVIKNFKKIKTAITAVIGFFKNLVTGVKSKISSAVTAVRNGVAKVKSGLSKVSSATKAVGRYFSEMYSKIKSKIGDAVAKIKSLPGKAKDALSGLGSTLYNAGSKLISGFIDGIVAKFGDVKSKLGELTGKLTSWKGPESLDKVLLFNAGELLIGGLINGLESKESAVKKTLNNLTKTIAATPLSLGDVEGGNVSRRALIVQPANSASGNTYNVYVTVENSDSPAVQGQKMSKAIAEFERVTGKRK